MNKTTKAKYDLATRMLKVDISIDEVALMSGLTIDEIEKLKAGIEPEEIIDEVAFAEKALKGKDKYYASQTESDRCFSVSQSS